MNTEPNPFPDGEVVVDYKTGRLMVIVDITQPATVEILKEYGVVPWLAYGAIDDDPPYYQDDVEYISRSRLAPIRCVSRNVHD
jgi:hypothetical protein